MFGRAGGANSLLSRVGSVRNRHQTEYQGQSLHPSIRCGREKRSRAAENAALSLSSCSRVPPLHLRNQARASAGETSAQWAQVSPVDEAPADSALQENPSPFLLASHPPKPR